jgi:hypothetical protein
MGGTNVQCRLFQSFIQLLIATWKNYFVPVLVFFHYIYIYTFITSTSYCCIISSENTFHSTSQKIKFLLYFFLLLTSVQRLDSEPFQTKTFQLKSSEIRFPCEPTYKDTHSYIYSRWPHYRRVTTNTILSSLVKHILKTYRKSTFISRQFDNKVHKE